MPVREKPTGENEFDILYMFAKERDAAFLRFMADEEIYHVVLFATKWGIAYPKNERILKICVCRAIQFCDGIDNKTKQKAIELAKTLGYKGDDIKLRRKKAKENENS